MATKHDLTKCLYCKLALKEGDYVVPQVTYEGVLEVVYAHSSCAVKFTSKAVG